MKQTLQDFCKKDWRNISSLPVVFSESYKNDSMDVKYSSTDCNIVLICGFFITLKEDYLTWQKDTNYQSL